MNTRYRVPSANLAPGPGDEPCGSSGSQWGEKAKRVSTEGSRIAAEDVSADSSTFNRYTKQHGAQ